MAKHIPKSIPRLTKASVLNSRFVQLSGEWVVVHGVLMRVFGKGVLFVGEPGRGKSCMALALLERAHELVADDAPEVYRSSDGVIYGQCPDSIFGMLHTRRDGFVDVRARFGATSLVKQCRIDMIIAMSGIHHLRRLVASYAGFGGATQKMRVIDLPTVTCDEFGARDVERVLVENIA